MPVPDLVGYLIYPKLSTDRERFLFATLIRDEYEQCRAYRAMHDLEFNTASANGRVDLLSRLLRHCRRNSLRPRYTTSAMNLASEYGHVAVLQWWKDRAAATAAPEDGGGGEDEEPLSLEYTTSALTGASYRGFVDVLQWWRDSGLKLKTAKNVMDFGYWHVGVLNFWKNSGLDVKSLYTSSAMDSAFDPAQLQWWKDSALELRYTEWSVDSASKQGRLPILDWWKKSGLTVKYSKAAMDGASENGRVDVLRWWQSSGLELKFSKPTPGGSPEVQAWWKESGLQT